MTIDVEHRGTATARWFDVWAGAAAVAAMCMVRGYGGVSGLPSGLSVTVALVKGPILGNGTAGS